MVNKKGTEDSLCKTSLPKCFKTTNFDTFHQGMSLQHVFQIPVPNSEFRLCNRLFWLYLFNQWTVPAIFSPQERNGTVFGFEHRRASYPIICQYIFLLKRQLHFESSNEMTIPGIRSFLKAWPITGNL